MIEPISFTVAGTPVPQGSKNPFVPTYKEGNVVRRHKGSCPGRMMHGPYTDQHGKDLCRCPILVNTVDDNKDALTPWREAVGWAARVAYKGDLLDGLLAVSFTFVRPRPKSHYGSGRNEKILRDSAPAAPGTRPDALKLARAIEDALTNVLWTDDALIVDENLGKRYCHRWEPEQVEITVRLLRVQTVGDMVAAGMIELPRVEEQFGQLTLDAVA